MAQLISADHLQLLSSEAHSHKRNCLDSLKLLAPLTSAHISFTQTSYSFSLSLSLSLSLSPLTRSNQLHARVDDDGRRRVVARVEEDELLLNDYRIPHRSTVPLQRSTVPSRLTLSAGVAATCSSARSSRSKWSSPRPS